MELLTDLAERPLFKQEFTDLSEKFPYPLFHENNIKSVPEPCASQAQHNLQTSPILTQLLTAPPQSIQEEPPKAENPRALRNRAEKQRRDKLNYSVSQLAAMVPTVARSGRKMDKTSVLRLTAHYLRSHQFVFGDSIGLGPEFSSGFVKRLLKDLKGFMITTTYRGIVVVASPNVEDFLGYTELDLLGQNIFNIVHEDDHEILKKQLMPDSSLLGSKGQLLLPEEPMAKKNVINLLANDRRKFVIRFKKLCRQRSESPQYLACHVEGSLRKADKAGSRYTRFTQVARRVRSKSAEYLTSGNDVVFIGLARPNVETFMSDRLLETFKMEYRTRHTVEGNIIQCDQRIALVAGYMSHEVQGLNAMSFMHPDDAHWVSIALKDVYDHNRLVGESCYRLMTKNRQYIYMRTIGCINIDENTKAVINFVCTNTVVTEEEGTNLVNLMKKKFAPIVKSKEKQNTASDLEMLLYWDEGNQLTFPDPTEYEDLPFL